MRKSKMRCPYCDKNLTFYKAVAIESLEEHVMNMEPSLKPTFHCEEHPNFFYDEEGEAFVINRKAVEFQYKYPSAKNSISAKLEVEIDKRGLKKKTYLPSWITFNIIQLYIEHHYKANYNGDVIWTWNTIGFLKKDERGDFCIIGEWWIETWSFLWMMFHRELKFAEKAKRKREREINPFKPSRNRAFPYRAFEFVIKVLYFKTYLKYRNFD